MIIAAAAVAGLVVAAQPPDTCDQVSRLIAHFVAIEPSKSVWGAQRLRVDPNRALQVLLHAHARLSCDPNDLIQALKLPSSP